MTYFIRTENGTATNVTKEIALAEANRCMMDGKCEVAEMTAISGYYMIWYKDGRKVTLSRQTGDMPAPAKESATDVEKTARKLSPSMVRTLKNLVRHGQIPQGLREMNELGCTYPAMQALMRRGLAETFGTGKFLPYHPDLGTGTYEIKAYRPTNAGRVVWDAMNS
jgi:hypothetical protein